MPSATPASTTASPRLGITESKAPRRSGRAILIIAAVVLVYLPVWRAGFIWDDDSHLTANPCIVGPQGFASIWTSAAGFYFPLVTSSLWLQHAVWALNPLPYHVVNVLLHALAAILLWRVLSQLGVPGAWLGSLLWALHPVQVESVAWISELKNTQSAVFYLLAISFYLKWRERSLAPAHAGGKVAYVGALLCGLAAILSKSSTVMLPLILALSAGWVNPRWRWRDTLSLLPFFALSAAASLWTIWEQSHHSGATGAAWNQTWLERVIIAGKDVAFYLGKLIWPDSLSFIYPRWDFSANTGLSYVPALGVVAALGGLVAYRRAARGALYAGTYFLLSLFPVLGFFNVYFFQYSFVGDHFQYLASMGVLALAGAAFAQLSGWLGRPGLDRLLGVGLCATLGLLTWRHAGEFHDSETLWRATLARNPACWMAHYNLGNTLRDSGRGREAIEHYEAALRANPKMADAHTALGIALQQAGRDDEAMSHFDAALGLDPDYAPAHNHFGVALAKAGRLPEAINHFERALHAKVDQPDVHNNLGNALRASDRLADAIAEYEQALRLDPKYAEAHLNLGHALAMADRVPEAIRHFEQALQLTPDSAELHNALGLALAMSDRLPEAIRHFERAVQLAPNLGPAHLNLALALEGAGRTLEAKRHYDAAERLGATSGR